MDYARLRTELTTDPVTLGYGTMTDAQASDALNSLTTGRIYRRPDISPAEIWENMELSDYPALAGSPNAAALSNERRDLAWLSGLANLPSIRLLNDDGTDTQIRLKLAAMFPAGSGTRTRLLALSQRTVSRAEELGLGPVSENDVKTARSGVW